MKPENVQITQAWREALKNEFQAPYFDELAAKLHFLRSEGRIIFPPGNLIFNAYNMTEPKDIKVIIIGQDPYHNLGEAMGLSFSVPRDVRIPPSLKNIYKELVNDIGILLPSHGDLTFWASQGVFLLNAVLTVEKNKPASHRDIGWQNFTDHTIKYLSEHLEGLVYMLWGNFAKSKKTLINHDKNLVLESVHPSPLAGNAFQGCRHFSKANDYIKSQGKQVIDWQL
ncbi:MAG: uracil-DNA glycosylase [Saprospiraceae bacterium]